MKTRGLLLTFLLGLNISVGAVSATDPATKNEAADYASAIEKATAAKNSGEYEQAAELFKDIQKRSQQDHRPDVDATCSLNLGIILWDLGEMQSAAARLAEAIPLFEKAGHAKNRETCRACLEIANDYGLGKESRSANRLNESLAYFDKAITLGRSLGIVDFELKCFRQKSLTYWQLGDFENFRYCNERGLEIAKKINHRREVGRCLNNIGAYYDRQNDYAAALQYFGLASNEARIIGDSETEAEAESNIGGIYLELGIESQAESYFRSALRLDRILGRNENIAKDLNNLGIALLKKGQLTQNNDLFYDSLRCFNECRVLLNEVRDSKEVVKVINNIGYLLYTIGDLDAARSEFEQSVNKASRLRYLDEMGITLVNLGYIEIINGRFQNAIRYFDSAIDISLQPPLFGLKAEASFGLGYCYEAQGHMDQALDFYRKTIEAMEMVRRQIPYDMFKISLARNGTDVFERFLNILYCLHKTSPSSGRFSEIFNMIERAKAQAFLESLVASGSYSGDRTEPDIRAQERLLSSEISDLNMKVMASGANDIERNRWLSKLENKEQEYLRIMSDIRTRKRPPAGYELPRNLTLSETQSQLLNDKTAIIEYFVGEKRTYGVLIARHHAELFSLPGREDLEGSLRGYVKYLSTPPNDSFGGERAAERIAKELLAPLQDEQNRGIDTLIIVPDGILNYLPFETLRIPDGAVGRFLLEKFRISYVPSVSTLQFLIGRRRSMQPSKDFLGFGAPSRTDISYSTEPLNGLGQDFWRGPYPDQRIDLAPLPFSRLEIHEAGKLFPARRKDICFGDQASEAALKRMDLTEYRILHFACHAFFNDQVPFRSALVLSPGDPRYEDGFLQVREIYDLKADAELIVLSACRTASGALERGEGLVGLTRSFFQAGARSIVSSLWSVSDRSTAEFMGNFYAALAGGRDKGTALRSAKLKMLNSGRSHPFYWAAFILSGDPTPVWPERSSQEVPN